MGGTARAPPATPAASLAPPATPATARLPAAVRAHTAAHRAARAPRRPPGGVGVSSGGCCEPAHRRPARRAPLMAALYALPQDADTRVVRASRPRLRALPGAAAAAFLRRRMP
jgi:hypothetical protein